MRTLVISASLPPFNDSSTLQLVERVRQFPEHGIKAVFVGAEVPSAIDEGLLQRLPANSTIIRTKPAAYDRILSWLSRQPGQKLWTWVYANAAYRLASPDVRTGWDRKVVRLCMQLPDSLRPNIIITQSGSYTAHIAGRRLAQHFSVPWVADLGDPWSLVDPGSWPYCIKALRNRTLEQRTIVHASGIVFATKETLVAYRTWLGDKLPEAIVLPCYGYDATVFPTFELEAQLLSKQMRLSHVGTAHQANRNLIPLIQAIGRLEKRNLLSYEYTLNLIGTHSKSYEQEAKRVNLRSAFFSDRVSYQTSVEWINRSSVLLIVGNSSTLQIPGKVYPYLGSGRPILYIGQVSREKDPAAQLLSRFPGILFTQNNLASIERAIIQIDRCYRNLFNEAMHRLDMPALCEYESNAISSRFIEFVRRMATKQ